jgi:hypothetical protein
VPLDSGLTEIQLLKIGERIRIFDTLYQINGKDGPSGS